MSVFDVFDRCRHCKHKEHGHARCTAKRCKCWVPIKLSRTRSRRTGRLIDAGEIRIDLLDTGYTGGYYEYTAPGRRERTSWGSLSTFLGSDLNWRSFLKGM